MKGVVIARVVLDKVNHTIQTPQSKDLDNLTVVDQDYNFLDSSNDVKNQVATNYPNYEQELPKAAVDLRQIIWIEWR